MTGKEQPRIVIIGAGFGGLFAAKALADQPVDVLIVDRLNYHTFTPLLYQVATSALDPSEVAYPIRKVFSRNRNIQTLMGEVTAVFPQKKQIEFEVAGKRHREHFDYLILATGSEPDYFSNQDFQQRSFEFRTLDDAIRIRNQILRTIELAAWAPDLREEQGLLNFVVVGGGPTGLETAGALYELLNDVLAREFNDWESLMARIYLIEKAGSLLTGYPSRLQQSALKQVQDIGIHVVLENGVRELTSDGLVLEDGTRIPAQTVIWTAGVKGSHPAGLMSSSRNKIKVRPTLESLEYRDLYVVGDCAELVDQAGRSLPMMIPVAQQQGVLAARNILLDLQGKQKRTFLYHDRGMMATIGRKRAVAWVYNKMELSGFPAWIAWLVLHLVTLIGFRNKIVVLINWVWNYLTYDRSVRIILD